jgi:hypothetical protein
MSSLKYSNELSNSYKLKNLTFENSLDKDLDQYLDIKKDVINKQFKDCFDNNNNESCKSLINIMRSEDVKKFIKDFEAKSPLEKVFNLDDPYLGILFMTFLIILLGIYLMTVYTINLKYKDISIIKKNFNSQFLKNCVDLHNFLRGPLINYIIILTYLCFFSSLIFICILIHFYSINMLN